jgi:mannitol/fructose-specific phosphotransferase system IIA component (Ntr-type)
MIEMVIIQLLLKSGYITTNEYEKAIIILEKNMPKRTTTVDTVPKM